ncbi:Gar1/Naf1 family protein [Methanobrevibacter sp. OttesenSCG-928-K11]|nr:Gar1/Naf1 family protein [Methanobrevibacter sp. OttesenSCG-928-K11]MDL2271197.1 Gar1/Naf1 family protein [Methanobrevibacter sp. OttesenSCG-928-I08]
MKFLGNSLHIANSGKLIARSDETPFTGAIVYDSNKNKIGKINNIFGPTKHPYVSINLFRSSKTDEIKKNYGEKLFVSKHNKKKHNKRGRRTRQKK